MSPSKPLALHLLGFDCGAFFCFSLLANGVGVISLVRRFG